MKKTVTFNVTTSDKELVKRIEKYQKDKKHKHFIDAVRELCDVALKFDEIKKK